MHKKKKNYKNINDNTLPRNIAVCEQAKKVGLWQPEKKLSLI